MSLGRDVALAVAPAIASAIATQLGEGVREALRARREPDKPCTHGRPGGRLCPHCSAAGASQEEPRG